MFSFIDHIVKERPSGNINQNAANAPLFKKVFCNITTALSGHHIGEGEDDEKVFKFFVLDMIRYIDLRQF